MSLERGLEREVRDTIRRNRWLTLSTASQKGMPQSSLVVYASDGYIIYILTGKNTVKIRNILKNPKVSVTMTLSPAKAKLGEEFEDVALLKEPYDGIEWGRAVRDLAEAIREGRPHRALGSSLALDAGQEPLPIRCYAAMFHTRDIAKVGRYVNAEPPDR